jgi:dihydroorotate dehydrogenase electron transfer subunit
MRIHLAPLTATTLIRPGVQLLELHAPNLAQTVQPGQFCMVRCSATDASDPLLRRPFYVHGINRSRGTCTLYVHVQGRGSAWLAAQQEGAILDILGPLGHGWTLRPTTRNALLIGEERSLSALTLLAQVALEQDIAVTFINQSQTLEASYPPALLSPEVEYHVVTEAQDKHLISTLTPMLSWADATYTSVSHETSLALYTQFERLRGKGFAQGAITRPLVCGTGVCFACSVETRTGQRLVCRDGPVFDLRDIVR